MSQCFRKGWLAAVLGLVVGCASSLPPRQAKEVVVLWKPLTTERLLDCQRIAALDEPIRDRYQMDMTQPALPTVGVLRERSAKLGANVLIAYWGGNRAVTNGDDASGQVERKMFVQGTAYLCESQDSLRQLSEDPVRVPSSSL